MKITIFTITHGGELLATRLAAGLDGAEVVACRGRLASSVRTRWGQGEGLIFIMAAGIVVRMIAPLLRDKKSDPAVVVLDELGGFAISLLSGHLGGANELARRVARLLGGQAVLTTASDILGYPALDMWARALGLQAENQAHFTAVMGKLVNQGWVTLASDYPLPPLPPEIRLVARGVSADLVITCRTDRAGAALALWPKSLVVGVGCKRGVTAQRIAAAVEEVFTANSLSRTAIRALASIDLKADEQGLREYAARQGYPVEFFDCNQLNAIDDVSTSEVVVRATGAKAVAEPAALLGAGRGSHLVVRKVKCTDVTIAVAEVASPWSAPDPAPPIW